MHKKDALKYYAVQVKNRLRSDKTGAASNIAKALGISTSAVAQWNDIVPERSAIKLFTAANYKIPLKMHHYT